jgi:hypothetical protein
MPKTPIAAAIGTSVAGQTGWEFGSARGVIALTSVTSKRHLTPYWRWIIVISNSVFAYY